MEINFFTDNIASPNILIPAIIKERRAYYEYEAFKNWEPEFHDVLNRAKRPDNVIWSDDPNGAINELGEPVQTSSIEYVARIAIAMQKIIVARAVAFLTGGKVTLKSSPANDSEQALYDAVATIWRDNKLQYKNSQIAEVRMSQMECAEIWYSSLDKKGKAKFRVQIFKPSDGYEFHPVFDASGDMISFGLKYDILAEKKRVMELWTNEFRFKFINTGAGWVLENEPIKLIHGKIPVVFHCQPKAEWQDVQTMINRLETLLSNYADINDYNGSPILFGKGEIQSLPKKGKAGKVIMGTGDSPDAKYLSIDSKPEMIIFEKDTLLELIYSITQTPNLSFDAMKSLGAISGVAFDRILIDAHLKAIKQQQGNWGESIQRRVNLLIAFAASANSLESFGDLEITPEFELFSINDETEQITNALLANGGLPVRSHIDTLRDFNDDADAALAEIISQGPQNAASTGVTVRGVE